MVDDCIFCGSNNTFYEFDDVIRCKDCWRIEVRSGSHMEEKYDGGHWMDKGDDRTEYCFDHEFVLTGTQKSWCKKCNVDAVYDFNRGEYITNEDLRSLQRLAEIHAKGDT